MTLAMTTPWIHEISLLSESLKEGSLDLSSSINTTTVLMETIKVVVAGLQYQKARAFPI